MAGRLENVRDLKLELPDETSAPARPDVRGFWLFLAIVVAGGAFLALKNMPLRSRTDSCTRRRSVGRPGTKRDVEIVRVVMVFCRSSVAGKRERC